MIANDCTGTCSCKFNYHTTTPAQVQLRWKITVLLILMEFMIITVTFFSYQSMTRIGLLKVCFCWGSLDGICISCEVPSIADTTLGILEQYPFSCHQTGMVGHWILRLHIFYKSTHVEFKTLSTVETLTPKHKQMNK